MSRLLKISALLAALLPSINRRIDTIMSNSFGSGGTSASLIFQHVSA